jgi:hypothetical protein
MIRFDVAVVLLALAASACAVTAPVAQDDPSPAARQLDPIEVVEAWVAARNDGDWDTQESLSSAEILDRGFGSRDETRAAVELNRQIHLEVCSVTLDSPTVGAFVACEVTVTDMILDAAGVVATNANNSTFLVVDGLVTKPPQWLPSSHLAEQAIEEWGMANDRKQYRSACPDGIAGQDVITGLDCARWIADAHPAWVEAVQAVGLK